MNLMNFSTRSNDPPITFSWDERNCPENRNRMGTESVFSQPVIGYGFKIGWVPLNPVQKLEPNQKFKKPLSILWLDSCRHIYNQRRKITY